MPLVQLSNRSLVDVSGPEAEHFLQNLITADLDQLAPYEAKPSALLTPQGKILFDFLVSRNGADAFILDCRADVADDFVRRLTLYKLRAKVTIAKRDQAFAAVGWDNESAPSENDSTALRDLRFPAEAYVLRFYTTVTPTADQRDWDGFRIRHGVAESGFDYTLGDAFPHDVLLDQNGGVGFKKGCYVGQEVVSRMQHRGTARRRVMTVQAGADLPAGGGEVTANDRAIGTLGTVLGSSALAIVRIDRVKDALDAGSTISASGVPLTLAIPGWANYTLPQEPIEAESA